MFHISKYKHMFVLLGTQRLSDTTRTANSHQPEKNPAVVVSAAPWLYRPHMAGYRPSVSEGGAMVV